MLTFRGHMFVHTDCILPHLARCSGHFLPLGQPIAKGHTEADKMVALFQVFYFGLLEVFRQQNRCLNH